MPSLKGAGHFGAIYRQDPFALKYFKSLFYQINIFW